MELLSIVIGQSTSARGTMDICSVIIRSTLHLFHREQVLSFSGAIITQPQTVGRMNKTPHQSRKTILSTDFPDGRLKMRIVISDRRHADTCKLRCPGFPGMISCLSMTRQALTGVSEPLLPFFITHLQEASATLLSEVMASDFSHKNIGTQRKETRLHDSRITFAALRRPPLHLTESKPSGCWASDRPTGGNLR